MTVLEPGSVVGYDVVTSGEVGNRLRLELIQGAQHQVLLEQRASVNRVSGKKLLHIPPPRTDELEVQLRP